MDGKVTLEIVYYVAMSLDGYIATPDGGVAWLRPFESGDEDYGYAEFYASVDGLFMGRKTYEQCLSFDEWPHLGKPCWVFSRRAFKISQHDVVAVAQSPRELTSHLAERGLRRLWLVGGGELAAAFRAQGLIGEYVIAIIPVILGAGIPLLRGGGSPEELTLVESKTYPNGIAQLKYRRAR